MANDIQSQVRDVNRNLRKTKQLIRAGASSALNKVAVRSKSRVVKLVSSDVKVQQKHVRKRVYIKRSNSKSLTAKLTTYRRDIPVISLGPAQTRLTKNKSTLKVGSKSYPGAFINRTRFGSWQVMKRKTKKRYPLEVLKIPISKSVDRHASKTVRRQMIKEYPRISQHEIDFRLKKHANR